MNGAKGTKNKKTEKLFKVVTLVKVMGKILYCYLKIESAGVISDSKYLLKRVEGQCRGKAQALHDA